MASTSPDSNEQPSTIGREPIRVAWLFPSLARAYYWQPVFKEFAALCPHTAVFTSIWPGFVSGYEGAFEVHTLPGLRYIDLKKQVQDSRRGFVWTPLSILTELAAVAPDVVCSSGVSGWTLCGLLFELLRRSKVIVYWQGCSAQSVGTSKAKVLARLVVAGLADAAVTNAEEG